MLESLSNQPVVVRNLPAVDLLLDVQAISRLAPFLHDEHTLGSAARAADVPASSLAYWVQRFVKAGLVEVTRLVPRAGKPIPHYRAISSEFHVPFDAMPPGTRDDFLTRGRRYAFEQFSGASNHAVVSGSERSGIRIVASQLRGVELNFVERPDAIRTPATEWWGSCLLNAEESEEVHRTLEELQKRFGQDQEGPGRTRYHLVLGFVPAVKK